MRWRRRPESRSDLGPLFDESRQLEMELQMMTERLSQFIQLSLADDRERPADGDT